MTAAASSRRSLVFLLITVAVDAIAFGIMMPVIPQLIVELSEEGVTGAATYGGWLMALFAAVQFFAAPVLGNLSDSYGRRPVLIASLAAFGVSYFIMGTAIAIAWLFIGQVLAGAFAATFGTASAYVADVTTAERRSKRFGTISAAFGLGYILGPMLGGVLGEYGTRVPFFLAGGLALLNAAYGYFALPESLDPDRRRPFSIERANPFGVLARMREHRQVFGLFGSLALMQIAITSIPATWAYFTMLKFAWSQRDIGFSFGLYGIASILVQGVLIGWVNRWCADRCTVYLGFSFMVVSFCGFAFADQGWVMLVFVLPLALSSMTGPALVSYMSGNVSTDAQGELQGAVACINGAATILAPLLMTQLFSYFSAPDASINFPGAPFLLSALLAACGLLLAIYVLRLQVLSGATSTSGAARSA